MTAVRNTHPDQVAGGDPAEGRWSQTEMLLAAAVDAINHQAWLYACAHTPKKQKKPTKPGPIPRPGAKQPQQRNTLTAEQYERLYAHINGLPGGPQLRLIKGDGDRRG